MTGFLIPRGNLAILEDRLKQLIANPDLRCRMGQAGRRHYEELFTLDIMLEKTQAVYEAVLAEQEANKKRWRLPWSKS